MDNHHIHIFHHHHHHYQPGMMDDKAQVVINVDMSHKKEVNAHFESTKICCELESDQGLFLEFDGDDEENDEDVAVGEDALESLALDEEEVDMHFLHDCIIAAPPTSQVDSSESSGWPEEVELVRDDLKSEDGQSTENVTTKFNDFEHGVGSQTLEDKDEECVFTLYNIDGDKNSNEELSTLMNSFYQAVGGSASKLCTSDSFSSTINDACDETRASDFCDLKLRLTLLPICSEDSDSVINGTDNVADSICSGKMNSRKKRHDSNNFAWINKRGIYTTDSLNWHRNAVISTSQSHLKAIQKKNQQQSVKAVGQIAPSTKPRDINPKVPDLTRTSLVAPKGHLSRFEHTELPEASLTSTVNLGNLATFSSNVSSPWVGRRIRHRARRDKAMQMVAEWLHKEPLWSADEEVLCSSNELKANEKQSENITFQNSSVLVHRHRHIHEHHHHYHYHHYHDF